MGEPLVNGKPWGWETAEGFLNERDDFLEVMVVEAPTPWGDRGWHVVLRLDGTYVDRAYAEAGAEGMRAVLRDIGHPALWSARARRDLAARASQSANNKS